MRIKISGLALFFAKVFFACGMFIAMPAEAKDMSAIDFNGDLLGKVIPDGTVVDSDNYVIGHITADGFVLNDDNDIIGGIVPQGVVISVDNRVLGKVNNDGSVTATNDSLIGKVLPSGLVVNYNYDVIGISVLPGLVYDDAGTVVGRVAGDGKFYNLSGQNNGFVTSSGHVYVTSATDNKAVLAGKLVSSTKAISSTGKFLGGVAPNGAVIDLKKQTVGQIHANGFVYNADNIAIGHVVENGYAFGFDGSYMGVVSYNGDIIKKGVNVAESIFSNRVISKDGNIIGFTISMAATANDLEGKYLGRITNNGEIVKGREAVGKIGASGNVIDNKGTIIGYINEIGPIYDYLGQLKASAAVNGAVFSLEGLELGYMHKDRAFAKKEKEIGRVLKNRLNFDNHNNFIGVSGINSNLSYGAKQYTISPYGYVFDENGNIDGRNYKFSSIFSADGNILTNILSNGRVENLALNEKAKLTASGYLFNDENMLLGKIISDIYATNFAAESLGYINQMNLIINNQNNPYAKILPNDDIVTLSGEDKQSLGKVGNATLSISINGDYLGANTEDGIVRKGDSLVGKISSSGDVLDNQGALYGKTMPFSAVSTLDCKFLGVVSDSGDVRNAKGIYLGILLANGQVINDSEEVIGRAIVPQAVSGEKGEILGIENTLGAVYNYRNENLGCQGLNDKIYNPQNEIIGQVVLNTPIMDFNNKIIGHTDFYGKAIDNQGHELGTVFADGSVRSKQNEEIGVLFKYTVAFDKNNIYLGRVNNEGQVVSDTGDIIGKVLYNGLVETSTGEEGFALYDLYVYDNEGKTVGYIAKNGRVYSVMNGVKGAIYNGFVLDKKQTLIARGRRDYDIRDENKRIIGYLNLDGTVINTKNIEIGKLTDDGNIVDNSGKIIAIAEPLQYYHKPVEPEETKLEPEIKENESIVASKAEETSVEQEKDKADENILEEMLSEQKENQIDNTTETKSEKTDQKEEPEETKSGLNNREIIGIAVDANGQYIGQVTADKKVINENGEVIAYVDENGNIISIVDGKKIGRFEPQKAETATVTKKDDWIKAVLPGVTISPYDNTDTVSHVGADGGIGPKGRYNPKRAAIINRQQADRRKHIAGRIISNGGDMASYTGWQERWDGVSFGMSTLRVDRDNMITADKPIPAVLARSLMSLGTVPVTAIVERNVYGDTGRNVIIPAGSKIIGGLAGANGKRADGESGGVKLDISWQRIIRPDGIAFNIASAKTGDAEGRGGGAIGYVDEQIIKKYGMPLVGTVATSAMAYLIAANNDATGEVETSKQQAANDARQSFIDRMDQILDKIIETKEQIQSVTYIPIGTRIIIYPMTDLWLRTTKDAGVESIGNGEKKDILLEEHKKPDGGGSGGGNSGGGGGGNNANNNNNNKNNTPQLLSDSPSQGQGNQKKGNTPGTMPVPSADGTGAKVPDEEEEEDGEIDLF